MKNKNLSKGDILVSVLVFAAIAVTILTGLTNWGASLLVGIRTTAAKEQAFQIAEAGIDYYRWHLAQYPTDYQDGTGKAGPYNHNFYDKNNNLIGGYSLAITPPPLGSTKVVIVSTGTTTTNKSVKRIVQAIFAEPSLATYAVVSNDYMRFGAGTMVNGPVTSNMGIHFDGIANNVISSAMATYTDPDWDGNSGDNNSGGSCTNISFSAHTCVGNTILGYPNGDPSPTSTTLVPYRPDVFSGRQFPVPATDFNGLFTSLGTLKNNTLIGGVCSSPGCWNPSNASGYHLVFQTSNGTTTFVMYKITSLQSENCSTSSWSIVNQSYVNGTLSASTFHIPLNGIIFVEDNLWVDGTINGARVTIAAGFGQNLTPSITINNNLLYTNTDGTDVIGLIAQQDINVGLVSSDTLTIDGALVAENGRVGRYYYASPCNISGIDYAIRSSLTLDGMIVTNQRYGFAYLDSYGNKTGYTNRNITYDANLLYSPPPNFPLASTQYQMASWKQIQ